MHWLLALQNPGSATDLCLPSELNQVPPGKPLTNEKATFTSQLFEQYGNNISSDMVLVLARLGILSRMARWAEVHCKDSGTRAVPLKIMADSVFLDFRKDKVCKGASGAEHLNWSATRRNNLSDELN